MELKFDEKEHKYTVGDRILQSVTEFIGDFFAPFNAEEIAEKLSKLPKNKGKTKDDFLEEWKGRSEHGTRVHNAIENYTNGSGWFSMSYEDILKYHEAVRFLDTRWGDFVKEEAELKLFDLDYGLAGTIDRVEYHPDNTISLIDWKTNNKIHMIGFQGQKAKKPLEDLDDCSYNKYMLQLNIYAFLLLKQLNKNRKKKLKVRELLLVHLTTEGYNVFNIKYDEKLVEKILKQRLNNNDKKQKETNTGNKPRRGGSNARKNTKERT